MRVVLLSTKDEFTTWLAHIIVDRFGLRWSARNIAKHCNLSANTVTAAISGKRMPSERVVRELAPVLRISENEFRKRAGIIPLMDLDISKPSPITEYERNTYTTTLQKALEIMMHSQSS